MLFEPYCLIQFIEQNGKEIIEYVDNWTEGEVNYYFFDNDLVINMQECVHISVAERYLRKLKMEKFTDRLPFIECPCPY